MSTTSSKIAIAAAIALILPIVLVGGAVGGIVAAIFGASDTVEPSQEALDDIPADYLALYQQAATACPGLNWSILAAIGKIESDHGRSTLPGVAPGTANSAGARGPMQFLQPTFDGVIARHTIPAGDANPPSPWYKHDAIYAASFYLCDNMPSRTCPPRERQVRDGNSATPVGKAHLLCANGARDGRDLARAIYSYNHADWYVRDVLHQAREYRDAEPPRTGATDWEPQQATSDDPTSSGKLTPRMSALLRDIRVYGPSGDSITCVADRPSNPTSDHPHGRACDIMFDPNDKQAVADGWKLAKRLTANRRLTGLNYLIWQGKFWSAENPRWVTYVSDAYGCPSKINVTGCHYDHVHVSVY